MRCPRCRADNPASRDWCARCAGRLFAWLGDPLGGLDLPDAERKARSAIARAAPSPGAARGGGVARSGERTGAPGKLLVGAMVALLASTNSTVVAFVVFVGTLIVLARWPRIDWARFVLLVAVLALTSAALTLRPGAGSPRAATSGVTAPRLANLGHGSSYQIWPGAWQKEDTGAMPTL